MIPLLPRIRSSTIILLNSPHGEEEFNSLRRVRLVSDFDRDEIRDHLMYTSHSPLLPSDQ